MEIPEGLIEYSASRLECLARELFRVRPRLALDPPIDLEFLIENEPNVTFTPKSGLALRHKVEGAVLKEEGTHNFHVWVDFQIYAGPWPRYNAALSEEASHLFLHKALFLKVKTIEDFIELQKHPEWGRYERDAKRFSRMIRMPADLFVSEAVTFYPRLVGEHGFADPIAICQLLRSALADRFEVSLEDTNRRILDAACDIERRVLMSVQSRSSILIPSDWTISARPEYQPLLFKSTVE